MLSDLVYVIPILIFYFPIIASLQKYKWLLKYAYCANKSHFWFLFLMYTIMLMLGLKKKPWDKWLRCQLSQLHQWLLPATSDPAPTLNCSLPGTGLPLPHPAPPPSFSLLCSSTVLIVYLLGLLVRSWPLVSWFLLWVWTRCLSLLVTVNILLHNISKLEVVCLHFMVSTQLATSSDKFVTSVGSSALIASSLGSKWKTPTSCYYMFFKYLHLKNIFYHHHEVPTTLFPAY